MKGNIPPADKFYCGKSTNIQLARKLDENYVTHQQDQDYFLQEQKDVQGLMSINGRGGAQKLVW